MAIFITESEIEQASWDILSSALGQTVLYGSDLAQTYSNKTMMVKLNSDNGLQGRWTRTLAPNKRLAQWRVKWLIEHSTSHQLLWCIDSLVLRNPLLRKAPNRQTV